MKICLWGNIASALKGNTAGGGELQLALLAKALARGGHEVVVIDIFTKEDFITEEGIKVFKIEGWGKGIPIIRDFTHRLVKLYRILKQQQADIYYSRILDFRNELSFLAARKLKAKFIISLASDLEALNFIMRWKYYYSVNLHGVWSILGMIANEIIYPRLFHKADLVLVQHEGQKKILQQKQIESLVFPNLYNGTVGQVYQKQSPEYFVYVGSLNIRKGFSEFYDLILKAPLHKFTVIGQPTDKLAKKYYEHLKSFKNVNLLGRLSHNETLKYIANSKAMISTSPLEGFPNVFIEAWASGVPVISLNVDPGGIIKSEKLGVVADGSIDKMLDAMNNIKNTNDFAKKAKLYVEHNHIVNIDKIKEINLLLSNLHNHLNESNCKVS